jgi:hypothetical protein
LNHLPTPFQRCFRTSNGYANGDANYLPTASNTRSNAGSPTPYNPPALEVPLAALGPCGFPPLKREGRKDLVIGNTQITRTSAGVRARSDSFPLGALAKGWRARCVRVGNALLGNRSCRHIADTELRKIAKRYKQAISRPNIDTTSQRPRDTKSREGIYARVAAASFTLADGKTCEATGERRNVRSGEISGDRPSIDRGWGGWHPASPGRPIIDLLPIFRGFSQKTCCPSATLVAASLEKSGLPIFGAARLENSGRRP